MPIQSKVVDVTPRIAEAWLKKNTKNRSIRKHLLERYASDMRSGLWKLTGEPIIFNCDGTLIDGQHRLQSVVLAEKPAR